MKTLIISTAILLNSIQISCAATDNNTQPSINKDEFPGFTITSGKATLNGYEYQTGSRISKGKDVTFTTCKQAIDFNINNIIAFEYFRFKLLLTSCHAFNKYNSFKPSQKSFFSTRTTKNEYIQFPALSVPYLNNTDYNQRKNKTLQKAYSKINVSFDRNGTKLLTKDDEFYIHILARGDFNGDKIEDLLVSSEWYARHAFGKHTDLVILSKISKDSPITIQWRLNKP